MGKSIKLDGDTYLDWSGITVDDSGRTLSSLMTQKQLANVTTVDTTVRSGTCSQTIYDFNAILIVFQIDAYKMTYYMPKIEYGTGWMCIPLLYSDSWKGYLSIRFTTGTTFSYALRGNLTGWGSESKRVTIYGVI